MQHNPSWEANSCSENHKNSPYFMEPEGLLLRSQKHATCPYPEADSSKFGISCPFPIARVVSNDFRSKALCSNR
jgi:hypothetical protein